MSNKLKIWLPLTLGFVLALGIQIGVMLQGSSGKRSLFSSEKSNDLEEVLNYINAKYVDTINAGKLMQGTIEDVLSKLDPHSVFIPAEELSGVNQELQGNFEGIGIEFFRVSDTITVLNVIANGPSEKAGVHKGDQIVTVNDTSISGKEFSDEKVIKKLKGRKNTQVKLGIRRRGEKELKYITVTRGTIPFNSINASFMMNKEVGYIKLERFSNTTYDEFKRAIDNLKKQGMKKLIFDLRGNGGGILEQATDILDEFLDKDKLMVYTQGRVYPRMDYKAHIEGNFETGGLCVLIDEGSASASEIVAGGLQDWDRATIIGRRSFGKGLVQEQYNLSDGAALRLTIAKYYTPSGRCIQKSYSDGIDKYYQDVMHRYSHGELTNKDSIANKDTTRYYTSSGHVVYGSGGIMPDIFVPLDTSYQSPLLDRIEHRGLIQEFAYQYAFSGLGNEESADKTNLAVDFSRFLIKQGLTWTDKDWSRSSSYLLKQISAYITRTHSGDNEYYKTISADDENIKKGLEVLDKK